MSPARSRKGGMEPDHDGEVGQVDEDLLAVLCRDCGGDLGSVIEGPTEVEPIGQDVTPASPNSWAHCGAHARHADRRRERAPDRPRGRGDD